MSGKLAGKKIAFLATDGFEQVELTKPWEAIKEAGAEVELVSLESGQIHGFHHAEKGDAFTVDKTLDEASASDYNGLVLPGGVHNPDTLRMNEKAVQFVRDFFEQEKPISAICHGPWLLVEAGIAKGRQIASWPSLKTDINNAGGEWVNSEVVTDNGITTSRNPDDIPAFCAKSIEEFCEGKHEREVA